VDESVVQQLNAQLLTLQEDRKTIELQITEKSAEVDSLKAQLVQATQSSDAHASKCAELQDTIDSLNSEISNLKVKINKLSDENKLNDKEEEQLETEIDKLNKK